MIKRLQDHRLGGYDPWNPRKLVEIDGPPAPPQTQDERAIEANRRQEERVKSLAEAAAIRRAAKKSKPARGVQSRAGPSVEMREETGLAAEGLPVAGQSSDGRAKRKRSEKA